MEGYSIVRQQILYRDKWYPLSNRYCLYGKLMVRYNDHRYQIASSYPFLVMKGSRLQMTYGATLAEEFTYIIYLFLNVPFCYQAQRGIFTNSYCTVHLNEDGIRIASNDDTLLVIKGADITLLYPGQEFTSTTVQKYLIYYGAHQILRPPPLTIHRSGKNNEIDHTENVIYQTSQETSEGTSEGTSSESVDESPPIVPEPRVSHLMRSRRITRKRCPRIFTFIPKQFATRYSKMF